MRKQHVKLHKDGSIWAKGEIDNGIYEGYWEWFRKNGIIMRSGNFKNGKQIGAWTTYDKDGNAYKVTSFEKK